MPKEGRANSILDRRIVKLERSAIRNKEKVLGVEFARAV